MTAIAKDGGRFLPDYEMFVCSSHFVNGKPSDPNPNSEVPNKREGGLNKRVSEWGYEVGGKLSKIR